MWGKHSKADPLSEYFVEMMGFEGLVGVEPATLSPTWSNGHVGEQRVAKILERFMINESMLDKAVKYRSWVDRERFLDHHPIFLKLEMSGLGPTRPF